MPGNFWVAANLLLDFYSFTSPTRKEFFHSFYCGSMWDEIKGTKNRMKGEKTDDNAMILQWNLSDVVSYEEAMRMWEFCGYCLLL